GSVVIRIGYQGHKEEMDGLDVSLTSPKEGETVSALSFMSLALAEDLNLMKTNGDRESIEKILSAIQRAVVIRPSQEYLDAIDTIYRNL
ncbi:MAG: hypothetical protein ABH845_04510, partial [Candidatus Omnitrophota bacterium]